MLSQSGSQTTNKVVGGPAKPPTTTNAPPAQPSIDTLLSTGGMIGTGPTFAAPSTAEVKPLDYGLLGILPIIRAPQKDSGPLAFGMELTTLFPTISSPEPVHSTFAGPWAAGPIKREPDFQIPPAYLVSPPPKIADKIDLFSDETLFYIFYTMPKDIMQVSAARTLHKREWMYHKEHKLWYKRHETLRTASSETGTFFYMDISRWEEVRKDNFTLEYDKLERNFM